MCFRQLPEKRVLRLLALLVAQDDGVWVWIRAFPPLRCKDGAPVMAIRQRPEKQVLRFLAPLVAQEDGEWGQKESLAPNWIWREVVDVAETTPAVGEGPDVAEV